MVLFSFRFSYIRTVNSDDNANPHEVGVNGLGISTLTRKWSHDKNSENEITAIPV